MKSMCVVFALALVCICCGDFLDPTGECEGTLSGNGYNSRIVEKGSEYWKENVLDPASATCATGDYFYFFQLTAEDTLNVSGRITGDFSPLDGKIHREFPSGDDMEHGVKFVRVRTSNGFLSENASGAIDFEKDAFSQLKGKITASQGSDYDLSCNFTLPEGEGFRSTNAPPCK